jgi:hypothetical protein
MIFQQMPSGLGMTWRQRIRQHLSITRSQGPLVIRRRWQPHGFALGAYGVMVAAMLWIPYADSALQYFLIHHPGYLLFVRVLFGMLLVLPVWYARRLSLRRHVFVFDRMGDYVTCDDRVVCALSEVESVRVGKPLGQEANLKELAFLIHGRNEVVIDQDDFLGASLEELGQAGLALALYARVPLWSDGVWNDPSRPEVGQMPFESVSVDPQPRAASRRLRRPRKVPSGFRRQDRSSLRAFQAIPGKRRLKNAAGPGP